MVWSPFLEGVGGGVLWDEIKLELRKKDVTHEKIVIE